MTTTIDRGSRPEGLDELGATCADFIHLAGDPGYDRARAVWNVAVSLRPAAVAVPRKVEHVVRVVRAAARAGLRVSAQCTGHGAGVLAQHRMHDVVVVRTSELRGVHVDPVRRVARVEAGATWEDVITAAAPHGLTAMHGSAPDVGVVGYTLGGGLSWFARSHGLACNHVVGVELVTPDGEFLRADERENPDLFWAVRGGGGNFGIVTTLEIALLPVPDVYAGMMLWSLERAEEVVRTWAAWCEEAPETVTTSVRAMRFPPIPELPDFLRGREVLILDGVFQGADDAGAELLAPFAALDPEMNTFARTPSAALIRLHMDPEQPTPSVGAGVVLSSLGEEAVDAFLSVVGPGGAAPVFIAELRQLGGALGRRSPDAGALAAIEGSHQLLVIEVAPTPEAAAAGEQKAAAVLEALAAWTAPQVFLNLSERPVDPATAFDEASWNRLREVRRGVDPDARVLANHAIRG